MPASSSSTWAGLAPFCGADTRVAPRAPCSGLSTSHITRNRALATRASNSCRSMRVTRPKSPPTPSSSTPPTSRKRAPNARMHPMPPSFVADPPMPSVISRMPIESASRMSSPVPKVLTSAGLRDSGGTSGNPEAAAISMMARLPSSSPYVASTALPSGSCTSAWRSVPPAASTTACTVPSPPSAIATSCVCAAGNVVWAASSSNCATCNEDKLPLKESEANTNFGIAPSLHRRFTIPICYAM